MNEKIFSLSRTTLIFISLLSAGLLASCASTLPPNPCTQHEQRNLSQKSGKAASDIGRRNIRLKNLKSQIAKNECSTNLGSGQPQSRNCRNLIRQANRISRKNDELQNREQVISKAASGKTSQKGGSADRACDDDTPIMKPVSRKAIPSGKRPAPEKPTPEANYKPVNNGSFITFENQPKPTVPTQPIIEAAPQKAKIETSPLSSILTLGTPKPAPQPETREVTVQPITPRVERPYDPNQKVRLVGEAFYHVQQGSTGRPVPVQPQPQ